ncbi:MAG: RhuM family protein [Candidatus Nealsonbacteria bacterium]
MSRKEENQKLNKDKIVIYNSKDNEVELRVKLEKEMIWLTQAQIAELFNIQRPAITKHLNNIFRTNELDKNSACSKMEHTASDGKSYKTKFYNLDAVIAVGYRVNSKKATQFRIWATKILKDYLLSGYAINQKRLLEAKNKFEELKNTISFIEKKSDSNLLKGQEKELLNLLSDYSKTLTLLGEYDKGEIKRTKGGKPEFVLDYNNCLKIIIKLKQEIIVRKEAGDIFGFEQNKSFEGIVNNIYQGFGGKNLYPDIESKASHLLYFTIKDHPFSDGNKRIASFLFVYFLDKNDYLFRASGERKINDNALTALALLVAESNPKEKDQMVALITQLLK